MTLLLNYKSIRMNSNLESFFLVLPFIDFLVDYLDHGSPFSMEHHARPKNAHVLVLDC